jgi:hypothetical protein
VAVLDLAEVRSGLMELDRRLDELSRGLVSKADADTGTSEVNRGWSASTAADVPASIPLMSPPPPASSSVSPSPESTLPESPSPSSVPASGVPAPDPASAERSPVGGASAARADVATVTVARAEEEAARILARVHERADQVKGQIRELLGVRDRLRVTTQEIMTTYGEALSALDREFDVAAAAAGESDEARRDLLAPSPVVADRRRFVGGVKVVAGPVRDLDAIRTLEDAFAGIDAVESISLTGFTDNNAQIELRLGAECELVTEFERALPFAFEVEPVSDADLGLRLRAA